MEYAKQRAEYGGFRHVRASRAGLSCFIVMVLVANVLNALLALVGADAPPLPCASLLADRLLVESMPSSNTSTCLTGAVQGTALYNRSVTGSSLDDDVVDILLPFPFRWFDVVYNGSVFVGSNSYITFGGSKIVWSGFNVFNPPFPSVLIGATDMALQLLTVGWVPQGWLVRYEGALLVPDFSDQVDPDTGAFLSSSTMVWELLFLAAGGLQLCTGILNHDPFFTTSAVSHQKSSVFAHQFNFQPNFKYNFVTTCAAANRVSLSTPIASVSDVQLNVMLFVTLRNASDVSTWTITLRGAGFSCPPNSSVSLVSLPPQFSTFGTARIVASNSSSPALVVSGIVGTINGSIMLSFSISGASTPYQPQDAFSDLSFAVHDRSGRLVTSGSNIQMDAISPYIPLEQTLDLSLPVIQQTQVALLITISPKPPNIIFRKYAPTALVITVSGAGWWFDPASVVVEAYGFRPYLDWQSIGCTIAALENKASVIRIDFDPANAGVVSSITNLVLKLSPITTPQLTQDSRSNIKCAILNARGSILAAGNSGSLGAIYASTMGSLAPSVSFSTPLKSVHDAAVIIKLAPTFRIDFQDVRYLILPAAGPAIAITMAGSGFTCSDNTPVKFLLPFGASGVASVDSSNQMLPVLSVTILTGAFEAGSPIWFQVTPVSTPSFEQPFSSNVTSAMYGDDGMGNTIVISSSVSGTIDSITGGMGYEQPSIQHTIVDGTGRIVLTFTPSASLPANSMIFVTLAGLGMTCSQLTPVVFMSPFFSTNGRASFINEPLMSVLAVSVPGAILAGANVTFYLSPVFASFSSTTTLIGVQASVADSREQILMSSVSGVFAALMSAAPTVKHYINSATNGTIILPAQVLAGGANCNNVINETMPPRAMGLPVVLKSSGSTTVIDCSGTGMRCLVVYRTSISITSVTFKGGASVNFMLPSTLRAIRKMYDAIAAQTELFVPLQSSVNSVFRANSVSRARRAPKAKTSDIAAARDPKAHFRSSAQSRHHPSKVVHARRHNKNVRPINTAGKRRQLLQSPNYLSAMFKLDQESCGGCVFVDAADHNASLLAVTFQGCRAVYGGGGFFNVSSFRATNGMAMDNAAQQGGGLFVLSSMGSSIQSLSFLNNTVATFLPSKYFKYAAAPDWQCPLLQQLGKFARLPDPASAAGGGAWFQLLSSAENCTFSDNTAIAAGTSDIDWAYDAMSGAHALGSGMFVVETRYLQSKLEFGRASLADLVFTRSQQLCAGWCVSGGALFVGITEGGTVMERLVFKQVLSAAVASKWAALKCGSGDMCIGPSVALGACVVIVDASSKSISALRDMHAEYITIRAVGSIFGGCITILQKISNAVAFNISFSHVHLMAMGSSQNAIYGLFAVASLLNSSVARVTAQNVSMSCSGRLDRGTVISSGGIYGGLLYANTAAGIQVSELVAADIRLQSSSRIYGGVVCFCTCLSAIIVATSTTNASLIVSNPGAVAECFGGVFYFGQSSDTQVSKSVTDSIQMHCSTGEWTPNICSCRVKGGVLLNRLTSERDVFEDATARNFILSCKTTSCFATGGLLDMNQATNISINRLYLSNCSVSCLGTSCKASGAVLSIFGEAKLLKISGITSESSTVACNGAGCYCLGGLVSVASLSKTTSDRCYNARNLFSDFYSDTVSVACSGESCFVLGGIAYFDKAFCLTFQNLLAKNSTLSSSSNNSKAAGAVFGVGASNGSIFSEIRSVQSTVSCNGDFSQALGGAVAVLSGNVTMKDCSFTRSTVRCSGYRCAAIGGFVSVVSTLIFNSDYNTQIAVLSCLFSFGAVSCTGVGCFVAGGALAAAKSFRSSIWLDTPSPSLSDTAPPQIFITMRSCEFINNTVSALSRAASAGGGALSVRSSVAAMFNCSFVGNSVESSDFVAFAGGGAIHIVNPSCQLTAQSCSFAFNDASSVGQGGALLVAFGAIFVGSNLTISNNRAGKGGGILIDASEAQISNSEIRNNFAVISGGGLFCSSNQASGFYAAKGLTGLSTINLQNVSVASNYIVDPLALGVGADIFIIGSVVFKADENSQVSMSGSPDRDITAAIVSVVTNSPHIFLKRTCLFGTMLRIAPTALANLVSLSEPPTLASMTISKCFPACLEVPVFESYVAVSGFLASCTPCPRGTYNLGASNSTSDTVATFCFACPFGADCLGGNMVQSRASYWGWKVSETDLPKEFVLLPEGYGCKNEQCRSIDSCGGNHSSVLCGGCNPGFSSAFFTTDCVRDDQCAAWKLWVLICLAFVYSLFYSIFFRYNSRKQSPPDTTRPGIGKIHPKRLSVVEIAIEQRTSAFHVLMWYYQLVGLLLAMPNPLQFFDGDALIINVIGLIFGTAPVSQVFNLPSLVFCTAKGSAPNDILLANILFYSLWAVVMIALSFQRVWLPIFRLVQAILDLAPTYWDNYELACEAMAIMGVVGKLFAIFLAFKWTVQGLTWAAFKGGARRSVVAFANRVKSAVMWLVFIISCKKYDFLSQSAPPPSPSQRAAVYPGEVRGRAWLDFGVTAYSALLSLMIQCTTCVTLQGYQVQGSALPDVRWFYDGRVACFSDAGERSGRWQIAALCAVVLLAVTPLALAFYMSRAMMKPTAARNVFDTSALPAYLEQFNAANKHWFTVMFYQRIFLSFAIFYTIGLNAPFIRGILAWLVCFVILALDFEFKPYANPDLQRLSTGCCFLLVALSSVLLRSQTLLSSGRAINFAPASPDETADVIPVDVRISASVIIACLTLPLFVVMQPFAFLLTCTSFIKNYCASTCKRAKIVDCNRQVGDGDETSLGGEEAVAAVKVDLQTTTDTASGDHSRDAVASAPSVAEGSDISSPGPDFECSRLPTNYMYV